MGQPELLSRSDLVGVLLGAHHELRRPLRAAEDLETQGPLPDQLLRRHPEVGGHQPVPQHPVLLPGQVLLRPNGGVDVRGPLVPAQRSPGGQLQSLGATSLLASPIRNVPPASKQPDSRVDERLPPDQLSELQGLVRRLAPHPAGRQVPRDDHCE